MEMIRDSSGFVANWVNQELGETPVDGSMAFGFIDKHGKLACGIALHDVKEDSVGLAIVSKSPRWCTKENIRKIAETIYDKLGKRYLFTLTPSQNLRACKLAEGMGFQRDGLLRECAAYGEDDLIVFGMLRRDCPFID